MRKHYQGILSSWDLGQVADVEWLKDSVAMITTQPGRKLILKHEGDAPKASRIGRMAQLLAALDADGLPVAAPIPNRNGQLVTLAMDGCFCLYPFVDYGINHSIVGTADRLRGTGAAIAQLHLALQRHEDLAVLPPINLVDDVNKWALPRMQSSPIGLDMTEAMGIMTRVAGEVAHVCRQLPEQLIHRDTHLGNILLHEDYSVAGFVDFAMSRLGPRVYDLCYCCTDMLGNADTGTRIRDGLEWGQMVSGLLEGYQRTIPLDEAEKRAMWHIMLVIQGSFVACYSHDASKMAWAIKNLNMLLWLHSNREYVDQLAQA